MPFHFEFSKKFVLLLFMSIAFNILSQDLFNVIWTKQFTNKGTAGSFYSYVLTVADGAKNNYIIIPVTDTSIIENTVYCDNNNEKAVIVKYDSTGKKLWNLVLKNNSFGSIVHRVIPTQNGDLLCFGRFKDSIIVEKSKLKALGSYSSYVLCINPNGHVKYLKLCPFTNDVMPFKQGFVSLFQMIENSTFFNEKFTEGYYFFRVDSVGNIAQKIKLSDSILISATSIVFDLDNNNNLYLVLGANKYSAINLLGQRYPGKSKLGNSATCLTDQHFFSINPVGKLNWHYSVDSCGVNNELCIDKNNKIYWILHYKNSGNIFGSDVYTESNNGVYPFIMKWDTSGNLLEKDYIDSVSGEKVNSISLTRNIYDESINVSISGTEIGGLKTINNKITLFSTIFTNFDSNFLFKGSYYFPEKYVQINPYGYPFFNYPLKVFSHPVEATVNFLQNTYTNRGGYDVLYGMLAPYKYTASTHKMKKDKISIFPNPNFGEFNILKNTDGKPNINIFNINGKAVQFYIQDNQQYWNIKIKNKRPGIYMVLYQGKNFKMVLE